MPESKGKPPSSPQRITLYSGYYTDVLRECAPAVKCSVPTSYILRDYYNQYYASSTHLKYPLKVVYHSGSAPAPVCNGLVTQTLLPCAHRKGVKSSIYQSVCHHKNQQISRFGHLSGLSTQQISQTSGFCGLCRLQITQHSPQLSATNHVFCSPCLLTTPTFAGHVLSAHAHKSVSFSG